MRLPVLYYRCCIRKPVCDKYRHHVLFRAVRLPPSLHMAITHPQLGDHVPGAASVGQLQHLLQLQLSRPSE